MPATYPCLVCRRLLHFQAARGWVHPDGSYVVVGSRHCRSCDGAGVDLRRPSSLRVACATCAGKGVELFDHHVATPDRSEVSR